MCVCISADLSRCVLNSLPGRFTFLKWFPLRSPRTYFVSHCKTRCSRAEVLLSGTLRGGGRGVRSRWTPDFRSIKQVLLALCRRGPKRSETHQKRIRSIKQVLLARHFFLRYARNGFSARKLSHTTNIVVSRSVSSRAVTGGRRRFRSIKIVL